MKRFNKLKLTEKLLILGFLPAVILSIALSIYFTKILIADAEAALQEKGRNIASYISKACVSSIFSGNTQRLKELLSTVATDPDILFIEITDANANTLVKTSLLKKPAKAVENSLARFKQIVFIENTELVNELDHLLLEADQANLSGVIGFVELHLDFTPTQNRQRVILFNSLILTALALGIVLIITLITSKAIAKPILELARDVKGISGGNFTLHSKAYLNQDEISSLTRNIHKMADEISNHQLQMEHKIQAATINLENKNATLLSTQKRLIQTTKSKSIFISHMSHEIRTPLNGIIGFLDLLKQTPLSVHQQHLLKSALASSTNLKFITNEVLDTAQLGTGKVIINAIDFSLREIVDNTVSLLSIIANDRNVTLNYHIAHSIPDIVHQDPIKVGQILINLLSNAIKFSPNSTSTLRIEKPADSNQIIIEVSDKGRGITANKIPSLFDEFSQFSETDYAHGSGLGLAITKKIITKMQGSITVQSELNKGSIFTVTLPYQKAKKPGITPKTELSILPNLTDMKILIADDNELNRELLHLLLKQLNADTDLAIDGKDALSQASQKQYDLILLDIRMPFLKGDQVLQAIRSDQNNINKQTPIIAVTAHITSSAERAEHQSIFDGHLIKPITKEALFKLISQILQPSQSYSIKKVPPQLSINKVFNKEAALQRMNNDPVFATKMLSQFFSELATQLEQINESLSEGAFDTASDIIHKLHGSTAYCGMERLKVACLALENALSNFAGNHSATAEELAQYELLRQKFFKQGKLLLKERVKLLSSIDDPIIESC